MKRLADVTYCWSEVMHIAKLLEGELFAVILSQKSYSIFAKRHSSRVKSHCILKSKLFITQSYSLYSSLIEYVNHWNISVAMVNASENLESSCQNLSLEFEKIKLEKAKSFFNSEDDSGYSRSVDGKDSLAELQEQLSLVEDRSKMKILADASLVAEIFLNRGLYSETIGMFVEHVKSSCIELYVSSLCIEKLQFYLGLKDPQAAEDAVIWLEKTLYIQVIDISGSILDEARKLPVDESSAGSASNFDVVVEAIAAIEEGLDAIVSLHPVIYPELQLPVLSVTQLIRSSCSINLANEINKVIQRSKTTSEYLGWLIQLVHSDEGWVVSFTMPKQHGNTFRLNKAFSSLNESLLRAKKCIEYLIVTKSLSDILKDLCEHHCLHPEEYVLLTDSLGCNSIRCRKLTIDEVGNLSSRDVVAYAANGTSYREYYRFVNLHLMKLASQVLKKYYVRVKFPSVSSLPQLDSCISSEASSDAMQPFSSQIALVDFPGLGTGKSEAILMPWMLAAEPNIRKYAPLFSYASSSDLKARYYFWKESRAGHSQYQDAESEVLRQKLLNWLHPRNLSSFRLDEKEQISWLYQWKYSQFQPRAFCFGVSRVVKREPQIVHFAGHGMGKSGAALKNALEQIERIDSEALVSLFSSFSNDTRSVLTVLDVCHSLEDKAALDFAMDFFNSLNSREPVEFAHNIKEILLQRSKSNSTKQNKRKNKPSIVPFQRQAFRVMLTSDQVQHQFSLKLYNGDPIYTKVETTVLVLSQTSKAQNSDTQTFNPSLQRQECNPNQSDTINSDLLVKSTQLADELFNRISTREETFLQHLVPDPIRLEMIAGEVAIVHSRYQAFRDVLTTVNQAQIQHLQKACSTYLVRTEAASRAETGAFLMAKQAEMVMFIDETVEIFIESITRKLEAAEKISNQKVRMSRIQGLERDFERFLELQHQTVTKFISIISEGV